MICETGFLEMEKKKRNRVLNTVRVNNSIIKVDRMSKILAQKTMMKLRMKKVSMILTKKKTSKVKISNNNRATLISNSNKCLLTFKWEETGLKCPFPSMMASDRIVASRIQIS